MFFLSFMTLTSAKCAKQTLPKLNFRQNFACLLQKLSVSESLDRVPKSNSLEVWTRSQIQMPGQLEVHALYL